MGYQNGCLHYASFFGHLDLLTYLLTVPELDVNARNHVRNTPLHLACENAQPKAVESLLNIGANVNAENINGGTPLDTLLYGVQQRPNDQNLQKCIELVKAKGGAVKQSSS